MQYTYSQHQWHGEYQKLCRQRDLESLYHVQQDCHAAMIANPSNPKCSQYADEALYCAQEICRRKGLGRYRVASVSPRDCAIGAKRTQIGPESTPSDECLLDTGRNALLGVMGIPPTTEEVR
jgi:hypothetical protein